MNCRVGIVTGAGQGIGKAVAARLLEKGCTVVIADIDAEAGEETAEELGRIGQVRFSHGDVSDEAFVARTVETTVGEFGRLDILINNAGISRRMPLENLSIDDWNRVIAVNLSAPFLYAKYASRYLRSGRGSIVNIASTRALMSEPDTEAYSASKGGIVALTHSLAVSMGPEVRVNCISPGWIDTSGWRKKGVADNELSESDHLQHPVGRVGKPEDIAALAAYLVSEQASFITGANFVVDGGMTRKMIYVE